MLMFSIYTYPKPKWEKEHVMTKKGVVVSDKMNKTRVVAVTRVKLISKYHRVTTHVRCFLAHDEKNVSHSGDAVTIKLSIPFSKKKRWKAISVQSRTCSKRSNTSTK